MTAGRWSRAELTVRVEQLARRHEGDAFVTEIAGFAKTLEAGDRALLEEVLLQRANRDENLGAAVRRRAEEPGWFRRTLARAEERAADLIRRRGG
jgi:hypothetical protein